MESLTTGNISQFSSTFPLLPPMVFIQILKIGFMMNGHFVEKTIYLPGAHHAISWKTQFSESAACLPQFDVLRNCVSSIFSRRIYPSLENRYIQVNASSKNILPSWSLINICTSCIIMIIIKYTSWHYNHHKSMHLLSYTIMVITNLCIIMTIIQVYIFADRFSSLL